MIDYEALLAMHAAGDDALKTRMEGGKGGWQWAGRKGSGGESRMLPSMAEWKAAVDKAERVDGPCPKRQRMG